MIDDTGIEQGRRFEGILVQKIRTDELALLPGEPRMRRKRIFHLVGTRLERLAQLAVTLLKVLQDFCQLLLSRVRSEREDTVHDVVCPRLVRRIEVPRLGRRPEW